MSSSAIDAVSVRTCVLILIIALSVAAWLIAGRIERAAIAAQAERDAEQAERRIAQAERDIFSYFASAARSQNVKILELGVELQWIALQRCGYAGDARFKSLEPAAKSRVQIETEELRRVAQGLIGRGLLRLFVADMRIGEKMTKLPSPTTLVCLTPAGEAIVNGLIGESK